MTPEPKTLTIHQDPYFALVYTKDLVVDPIKDIMLFLITAQTPDGAKAMTDAFLVDRKFQGFIFRKAIGVQGKDLIIQGQAAKEYAGEAPGQTVPIEILPPKERFVYNVRLLLDKADADESERKVAENLIERFLKKFDAEGSRSS